MSELDGSYEAQSARFYARLERMKAAGGDEAKVAAIWDDVTDRRGWRQEVDQFDYALRGEILDRWLEILTGDQS